MAIPVDEALAAKLAAKKKEYWGGRNAKPEEKVWMMYACIVCKKRGGTFVKLESGNMAHRECAEWPKR